MLLFFHFVGSFFHCPNHLVHHGSCPFKLAIFEAYAPSSHFILSPVRFVYTATHHLVYCHSNLCPSLQKINLCRWQMVCKHPIILNPFPLTFLFVDAARLTVTFFTVSHFSNLSPDFQLFVLFMTQDFMITKFCRFIGVSHDLHVFCNNDE